MQVDPAAFEIAGHIVLKRAADFDAVSQDTCWRLLECASLDQVRTHKQPRNTGTSLGPVDQATVSGRLAALWSHWLGTSSSQLWEIAVCCQSYAHSCSWQSLQLVSCHLLLWPASAYTHRVAHS